MKIAKYLSLLLFVVSLFFPWVRYAVIVNVMNKPAITWLHELPWLSMIIVITLAMSGSFWDKPNWQWLDVIMASLLMIALLVVPSQLFDIIALTKATNFLQLFFYLLHVGYYLAVISALAYLVFSLLIFKKRHTN